MLRQHESQPSQAQFHFGGESSTSPVETLSERGAGAGYGPYTADGPDGPGGIVDMNGWDRQSHSLQQPQPQQQLQTQQTSITTKGPEIQSDRQRQEQGYTPQSNNNHLQGSLQVQAVRVWRWLSGRRENAEFLGLKPVFMDRKRLQCGR